MTTSIVTKKIVEMSIMQDELNSAVNPQWREAGYDWLLAAGMEATEAIDHHGWKWWKKSPDRDILQIKLELVDIFHFLLARAIEIDEDITHLIAAWEYGEASTDFVAVAKKFIASSMNGTSPYLSFVLMCNTAGLHFEELYRLYVAKNTLNLFRTRNGYKTGGYVKEWTIGEHKMEDNKFLELLMRKMDWTADGFPKKLMTKLEDQYRKERENETRRHYKRG